ncbi:MAG: short-chain fatty acid transporter [Saprospiraceae bacterium]|nr:short-chain fatty acid transporter [Saprospiraceae bacterium]
MPSAFVFAMLLTIATGILAWIWVGTSPMQIVESWYMGFFDLLGFAMQIVLIIITGFSIALSPIVSRGIDALAPRIKTPTQVYVVVVFIGMLLSLISFGWIVITAVLARELSLRVNGIHYPFLIACVYFSFNSWVMGLSSSIPLLLNSENNFLIEAELLSSVIPTSTTIQSSLNFAMCILMVVGGPVLMFILRPKTAKSRTLKDLHTTDGISHNTTIEEEAISLKLPFKTWSDKMNNSVILQLVIVLMGGSYVLYHFATRGMDFNFNIMIFIFIIIGLLLHRTPVRYAISMQRSSSNISGILFQYPFYAGIMGIMLYTGLGDRIGDLMASLATVNSYPLYAYVTGAIVNFAIPSAGGEFAVIGPSLIGALRNLGEGLSPMEMNQMIARASMSVAYGESLSNMLQPFYLLIIMPIMGSGVKLQARDIMGYLLIPFLVLFAIQSLFVIYWPI